MAVGREVLAAPSGVARLQFQARQASHQVELGWERVPKLDRIELRAARCEHDVLAGDPLLDRVVQARVKAHAVGVDLERADALVLPEPAQVGDERLDDERAAGLQPARHVREAPHLPFLREQGEHGVEHDVHEREPPVDANVFEVADRASVMRLGRRVRVVGLV